MWFDAVAERGGNTTSSVCNAVHAVQRTDSNNETVNLQIKSNNLLDIENAESGFD
jgi:hypothetical protein